jgi:hypothetical protein
MHPILLRITPLLFGRRASGFVPVSEQGCATRGARLGGPVVIKPISIKSTDRRSDTARRAVQKKRLRPVSPTALPTWL